VKLAQIFTKILHSPYFPVIACCNVDFRPLIPKAQQHTYEPKYIFDQNNCVKFPSLVCEIWCSQCFWVISCCDLDLWPNQYVPCPWLRPLILVKLAQIFTKILYSSGYLGHCLAWPWPLT